MADLSRGNYSIEDLNMTDYDDDLQSGVQLQEIPLIAEDTEALEALRILREKGYTSDEVKQAYEELEPVPVTRTQQISWDQ